MRLARAVVVLFTLSLVMSGGTYLAATHYYHVEQASQARQNAMQAADQRRQSAAFEAKLCTTLGRLAALEPPPGSPVDNPSRAYLQDQHDVLAQLGPDVGCGGRR